MIVQDRSDHALIGTTFVEGLPPRRRLATLNPWHAIDRIRRSKIQYLGLMGRLD
jgi:hypothetical protein